MTGLIVRKLDVDLIHRGLREADGRGSRGLYEYLLIGQGSRDLRTQRGREGIERGLDLHMIV